MRGEPANEEGVRHRTEDETQEPVVVAPPHRVADPRAVVIMHRNATIADTTVEHAWRLYNFASWAFFTRDFILVSSLFLRCCMHAATWICDSNLVALGPLRNAEVINLLLFELRIVRSRPLFLRLLIYLNIVLPTTITKGTKTRGQTLLYL